MEGHLDRGDLSRDAEGRGSARRELPLEAQETFARPVGRRVVHEDDLLGERHERDPPEQLVEGVLLVVDGDDDRDLQVMGSVKDPG